MIGYAHLTGADYVIVSLLALVLIGALGWAYATDPDPDRPGLPRWLVVHLGLVDDEVES